MYKLNNNNQTGGKSKSLYNILENSEAVSKTSKLSLSFKSRTSLQSSYFISLFGTRNSLSSKTDRDPSFDASICLKAFAIRSLVKTSKGLTAVNKNSLNSIYPELSSSIRA